MFFDSWADLGRTLVVSTLAYAALVALLRASGKRTLAKLNAFDLVVTVALGSTLATALLSKDVSLAEGALALLMLVLLQFIVAWTAMRSRVVRRAVKSTPRALLVDGAFDQLALNSERVTVDEVKAAVRGAGRGDLADIAAVVLETDGSLSVIPCDRVGARTALDTVGR